MPTNYEPKRVQKKPRRRNPLPLLLAAAAVCLGLIIIPSLGQGPAEAADARTPGSPAAASPAAEPTPTPTPTPTPEPTPTPVPAFDFTQPAPEGEEVTMDYFSDALFIGDSRTDGLRLYSGITGADFYCYKGLTIFEVDERKIVELDSGSCSVSDALEKGPQYAKIYISLGVNELGYYNDNAFHQAFGEFLEHVKATQPGAVIYLENLVPVNPEKCAQYNQPYYVNNDRVAAYNAIYPQLAAEHGAVLLDVASALTDENGILPADASADGVHFTKAWYQKWLAYLMNHTVEPEEYEAGRAALEGENET